ncbi:hypothetical protein BJ742DRAFT_807762 [Cladochytrium replicatum]|nr:hypothetical protein BJ742DRAFT_807762 [Cladochytrium replicatum]
MTEGAFQLTFGLQAYTIPAVWVFINVAFGCLQSRSTKSNARECAVPSSQSSKTQPSSRPARSSSSATIRSPTHYYIMGTIVVLMAVQNGSAGYALYPLSFYMASKFVFGGELGFEPPRKAWWVLFQRTTRCRGCSRLIRELGLL